MLEDIKNNPEKPHWLISPHLVIQTQPLLTKEQVVDQIKALCNRWYISGPNDKEKIIYNIGKLADIYLEMD